MRYETYTCDVCGAPKGVGNRWLIGWEVEGGFALADWGFVPPHLGKIEDERVFHFCSEAHALSEQSKHLRQDRHAGKDIAEVTRISVGKAALDRNRAAV
jgi:hypothetical protein